MFKFNEEDNAITFQISSDHKMVDRLIKMSREFLKEYGYTHFSEFQLVIRELLNNAIEHGNGKDPSKTVSCSIHKLHDDLFRVTVKDQGDGFDYSAADMTAPDNPDAERNRGYGIINAFVISLEFNERGNEITVHMMLHMETDFETTQSGRQVDIKPSGDITASTADKFRQLLISCMDDGVTRYRFNLANVRDMDSVSLTVFFILSRQLKAKTDDFALEITEINPDLMNLFRMTRLDRNYTLSAM